jgi:hypothetical protein
MWQRVRATRTRRKKQECEKARQLHNILSSVPIHNDQTYLRQASGRQRSRLPRPMFAEAEPVRALVRKHPWPIRLSAGNVDFPCLLLR